MEQRGEETNPSTSFLLNLVGDTDEDNLDADDPIINYLVKNEGFNAKDDDLFSEDSDIEVLIEEHILLEKLKQVTGKKQTEINQPPSISCDQIENEKEGDAIVVGVPFVTEGNSTSDLILMKRNIDEAMQINLKMREELLALERKLVQKYREACDKKQENVKEDRLAYTKTKLRPSGPTVRFFDSFRNPYFKYDGSVAPWNSDHEKILTTNIPRIQDDTEWSVTSISSLCLAIRKEIINDIKSKRTGNNKNAKEMDPNDLYHLKNASLYDLVKSRSDDSLNWRAIADSVSKSVSERDCRQMWALLVRPSLKTWSADENNALLQVAKANNLQNWDKIALELDTGRTGFETFLHHQNSLLMEYNDGKWSREEEKHLSNVINKSRIGKCISWDKVTYCLDTKSVYQIYAKWHGFHAPQFVRGSFTEKEDRMLLGMVHKFGVDMKGAAAVFKNRSIAQLTARYKNHLIPHLRLKVGGWSVEEDEKLLNLVKEHGEKHWSTIAKHFETRSRIQIRHRYQLLKRKLSTNPNLNLNLIYRPKRTTSKKRMSRNRSFFNKVISAKGKNVKLLLQTDDVKQKKRLKPIDLKLTQYYQMRFLTEDIDENKFNRKCEKISKGKNSSEIFSTEDGPICEGDEEEVNDDRSFLRSLLFSLVALRNFYEVKETDNWSQKDRTNFYRSILELHTENEAVQKDLLQWHKIFCSLFTAPVLLSNLNVEEWKCYFN